MKLRALVYANILVFFFAVWNFHSDPLSIIVFALARIIYVGTTARLLLLEEKHDYFTAAWGAKAFQKFKNIVWPLMLSDSLAFVMMCATTHDSARPLQNNFFRVVGLIMIVTGTAFKAWAAKSLKPGAYFWKDFFVPDTYVAQQGPYRFLENPMYTVGYMTFYGFAVFEASWTGLVGAFFAQMLILHLYWRVEAPHFENELRGGTH